MSDGAVVILGVTWRDGEPLVRLRTSHESASRLQPLIDFELRYQTTVDRQASGTRNPTSVKRVCVGHKPFRANSPAYVDCWSRPQDGRRTCRACAIVEATFASNLHHAHTRATNGDVVGLDPDIAAHLRQPNFLYLAGFRDGSIKVGTSTATRLTTRLAEQGAWLATIVASSDDGITIRLLEDWITERLGLPQAVSVSRKLGGLVRPVADRGLADRLENHRQDVHQLIGDSDVANPPAKKLDQTWRHPRQGPAWDQVHAYPASLNHGPHELDVIDACGRIALLQRPGGADHFVADLQDLFGLELRWGSFGSAALTVQDSLF